MMKKFVFVILHYKNYYNTIQCIDSILENIIYNNFDIVVVDNCSANGSAEKIKEKYYRNSKINVLIRQCNTGYAKGNNFGCEYAKKNLNPDFLCVLNNDTTIEQQDFITKIINKHHDDPFDILGPDIISMDGLHQNPLRQKQLNIEEVNKRISHYRSFLFLNRMHIEEILMKIVRPFKKKSAFKEMIDNKKENYEEEQRNIVLHGSCLVFSKSFFENKENVFFDKTFMYAEEYILAFLAEKYECCLLYYPEVSIHHKECGSIEVSFGQDSKKRNFEYTNALKSYKELKKLMMSCG